MNETRDCYAGSATGWAAGAVLVYAPLADALADRAPSSLEGRRVLDVGAGTGVGSAALRRRGALPVAVDLSHDMLAWERAIRPPSAVADVIRLPFRSGCFDAVFASFVLNHLTQPVAGMLELSRLTTPGGSILATVYSNESRSAARDEIDRVAGEWGMTMPDWYLELKTSAIPLLGSASAMRDAARAAGLTDIEVEERAVDIGVDRASDLVAYRLGQANYTDFLATLDRDRAEAFRRAAIDAAGKLMEPYRPRVVFLSAIVG